MRLIDADLLKKNCKCTGTFESNFQCVSLKTLGDLIDAQPTAYEVDKVVEELESIAKLAEDRWTNGTSKHAYQEHKCWVKATEIVKHGGVVEDVNK